MSTFADVAPGDVFQWNGGLFLRAGDTHAPLTAICLKSTTKQADPRDVPAKPWELCGFGASTEISRNFGNEDVGHLIENMTMEMC